MTSARIIAIVCKIKKSEPKSGTRREEYLVQKNDFDTMPSIQLFWKIWHRFAIIRMPYTQDPSELGFQLIAVVNPNPSRIPSLVTRRRIRPETLFAKLLGCFPLGCKGTCNDGRWRHTTSTLGGVDDNLHDDGLRPRCSILLACEAQNSTREFSEWTTPITRQNNLKKITLADDNALSDKLISATGKITSNSRLCQYIFWLRDLGSNQDYEIQSLVSCH